ncbi:MAG: sulfotransferase domain-containing protein [Anaerolineae bacterium]|nr:sulfotransferase domain-containing protein [Anaerolineae bacterium]
MTQKTITIVSGLPRSGTSMMMKMLHAGGMDVLTDEIRTADEDNPKGYYEFERVKQLPEDTAWLPDAENKAVKVISALLLKLPSDYNYKVIFMRRNIQEILESQRRMLIRRGEPTDRVSDDKIALAFQKHLEHVESWLDEQPNIEVLYVDYNATLRYPAHSIQLVDRFLGSVLDTQKMARVIDPALYRRRG